MPKPFSERLSHMEFDRYYRIAQGLKGKQARGRERCISQLAKAGIKAVGPLMYAIQMDSMFDGESFEEYDNFNNACFEVMKRIGEPAVPILERYTTKDDVHESVNVFAQEAIFEVLGLDEEERQRICRHREAIIHEDNGKTFFTCNICEKVLTEEEWLE